MRRFLPAAIVCCALLAGCRADRTSRAPAKKVEAAAPAPKVERYAVLVNGDYERRHKNNIALAYSTLRTLGFEAGHIWVVSPPDRRTTFEKGTLRVAPVPDSFWKVMDGLVETVKPNDLLVVYATGHGDTEEGDSLLELRRGEVWSDDLREEIDHYRGNTVLVMDQCYSGGFSDALKGTKSRAIAIVSVDGHHETNCRLFAQTFWESLLHPERADRNRDGRTSVREAFEAALKAHQSDIEGAPDLRANGSYHSFNGLEDTVLQ